MLPKLLVLLSCGLELPYVSTLGFLFLNPGMFAFESCSFSYGIVCERMTIGLCLGPPTVLLLPGLDLVSGDFWPGSEIGTVVWEWSVFLLLNNPNSFRLPGCFFSFGMSCASTLSTDERGDAG